ncbi:MAG: FAD:protein FMN transferase [Verrucomicrobiota bacterium]
MGRFTAMFIAMPQWRKFSFLVLVLTVFLSGCSSTPEKKALLERYEFEEPQMGVPFKIILFARNETEATHAADLAFARIAQLNQIMSDYNTDSEITELSLSSGQNKTVKLSPDLWKVLALSQELSHRTDGAFDVTIGPCVGLWRKARREKQLPSPEQIAHFQERVGYTNLVLNAEDHSATLLKPNMRLDVGAIAKGYASDEAIKVLREAGIHSALVAASGDISLGDPPPGEDGWKVEISGYDQGNSLPGRIATLSNCGIATSGDVFQRLEINGVRYSHILDPFTCVGMTNHALSTVIAPNCTIADGLATTMTILEPERALAVANHFKAAVRIIELNHGTPVVYKNRRFKSIKTVSRNDSANPDPSLQERGR